MREILGRLVFVVGEVDRDELVRDVEFLGNDQDALSAERSDVTVDLEDHRGCGLGMDAGSWWLV